MTKLEEVVVVFLLAVSIMPSFFFLSSFHSFFFLFVGHQGRDVFSIYIILFGKIQCINKDANHVYSTIR